MKTFEVNLTRCINQVYRCIVEAEDEETAGQTAISEAAESNWEDFGDGYDTEVFECRLIDDDDDEDEEYGDGGFDEAKGD